MLKKLKEMQIKDVFKILPSGMYLDDLIMRANHLDELEADMPNIIDYIKELDDELSNKYNVSIGTVINDFYDKFYYELYDMYLISPNPKTRVCTKTTTYGQAGEISLGLKYPNCQFSLGERKLLKIINHYYISLNSTEQFKDTMFYIPYTQLKGIMFSSGTNHKVIKDLIIETCNQLNMKQIYWDFSKTKYVKSKKLKDKKLDMCNGDKLIDITIIYQPWGNNTTIKGIICKVNNLLKLRYLLKQISPLYPTQCLQSNYLEFVISDKLLYHMKMKKNKNNNYLTKNLSDLAKELYQYKDNKQTFHNHLYVMKNDNHKPRELLKFINAISNVAYFYSSNTQKNYKFSFIAYDVKVSIIKNSGIPRRAEDICNELLKIISGAKKEVEEISSMCDKLNIIEDLDINTLWTYMSNRQYLNKSKIKEYYKIASEQETGQLDVEKLKNTLIDDICRTKGNLLTALERGLITLNVEYK